MHARVGTIIAATAIALGMTGLSVAAGAQNARITLLHINDVYEIAPVKEKGGLAPLATLVKKERAANPNTVFTVGGDFLSPSLLSSTMEGKQMVELFNTIGVDLVTFGNHEFDFGPDVVPERVADSKFPWVASNVRDVDNKPYGGAVATFIKQFDDVKVGYLGVLTEETKILNTLEGKIEIFPPAQAAAQAVAELKGQGADVIVALTHLTIAEDRELAKIKDIDVVLGGHDHDPFTIYEDGVLIHKSGYDAHYLGAIDIDVSTKIGDKGAVTTVSPAGWRLIHTADAQPDAEVAALVKGYTAQLDVEMGAVIGKTTTDLDSRHETVRTAESSMGNLIADALREALKADIGLMNGGGIRGDALHPAGSDITRKDILTEMPFGNVGVLVEIQGADLLAALEHGFSRVEEKAGRFPQVSGMAIAYNPKAEPGKRVIEAKVGEQAVDSNATYKVATIEYLLGGGDGYAALANSKTLVDASGGVLVASLIMDYIAVRKTIAPAVEGRIVAME